jgi:hypothetical protein
LLGALRRYESAPPAQREATLRDLLDAAVLRRARWLALIDRDPTLAAARVMPAAVRARLPASAQALVERHVSVAGTVLGDVADDVEQGRSQLRLRLRDATGQTFDLRAGAVSQREQLGWVGRRVQVGALRLDRQLVVGAGDAVQLAAFGQTTGGVAPVGATTAAIQGPQNTLVVMLNFADKAVECSAADVASRVFGSSGATVDKGYRESSGNLVSFAGTAVGPYTINYSSLGACDYNGWASAANSALQTAGIPLSSYQRVSYVTPRNANCGWTGLGALGGASPTPSWIQSCSATGTFAHEIGHNLLFYHAATPTAEYGDLSDPMGMGGVVQFNGANRVMAGWVAGDQLRDVVSGGSFALSALETATAGMPRVLRLPKADSGESYYVSLRKPVGVDAGLWYGLQDAVTVHKATGTMPSYTTLMATLAAGQSWSDEANGITVTNQGVSTSAATVAVGFGGASCARQAPTVVASPTSQAAAPGGTLGYTVAITNNDGTTCPAGAFNLAQSLPAGFGGTLSASSVTLAAGTGTSVAWSVTSPAGSADGLYTLSVTASEGGTSQAGTAQASYTVLAPVQPPPPPSATDTTSPVVALTSPTAGATLSGNVALAAQASDNAAVSVVEFFVDGKRLAADSGAPYGANWNTRKSGRGSHAVRVRATDSSGNTAEQTISVTVK